MGTGQTTEDILSFSQEMGDKIRGKRAASQRGAGTEEVYPSKKKKGIKEVIEGNARRRRSAKEISEEYKEVLNYLEGLMSGADFGNFREEDVLKEIKSIKGIAAKSLRDYEGEDKKGEAFRILKKGLDERIKTIHGKKRKKILLAIQKHLSEKDIIDKDIEGEDDEEKKDTGFKLENLNLEEKKIFKDLKKGCLELNAAFIKSGRFKSFEDAREYLKVEMINLAEKYDALSKERSSDFIHKMVDLVLAEIAGELEDDRGDKIEKKDEDKESEKSKSYVQESYDKLHSSGVSDEDLKYFFNLPRKERDEILSLEGNKLAEALRNQKLKNAREKQDILNEELSKNFNFEGEQVEGKTNENAESVEKSENGLMGNSEEEENARLEKKRVLKVLSEQLQKSREEYLKKEDEAGVKISRLKNFFKNFVSVDKDYQIEKELEIYKENYERALKNYMEAIVELEGIEDSEEAEIMYRHAKFGETLSLMSAKEDLKFQKHPLWESMKRDLSVGSSDLVDKYSELLGKPKKWITEKTHSKFFGFGGGLVAVGGAMSFLASHAPGIRALTVSMGVAVASKGFYKRAETKNVIEKEKELKAGSKELMRRIVDLQGKIDQELIKRELNISLENIPESARKEVEDYYRRLGLSFVKGAALGATTYFGGQYLRESGLLSEGIETIKKSLGVLGASLNIEPISEMVIEDSGVKSPEGGLREVGESQIKTSPHGTDTHQGPIAPKTNLNPEVSDPVESKAEIPASELPEAPSEAESAPVQPESIESNLEQIKVIEGKGIKDSLAQFLVQNYEQLTEGKMGWDPEKYASVEEWADKRAIGIVGELKAQYPDYNFDQVSAETEFRVDLSNKADIQIVGLEDKFNLGGNPESIEELKSSFEETGEGQAEKIEGNQEEVTAEEEGMTQNPTVEASETIGNNESETIPREDEKFREAVLAEMKAENPDFDLEKSLEDIRNQLRGGAVEIGETQSPEINLTEARMSLDEFFNNFATSELPELLKDNTGLGEVFRGINSIGKESVVNQPEGGVFDVFRQTFSAYGGDNSIAYNGNGNVRSYVLRAMGNLYETGRLESFKNALRNIEIT